MIKYETDSRKVKEGQTFVAITGHTVDGHNYIDKAVQNGAAAVVVEKDVETTVPVIKVDDTKEFLKNALVNEYSQDINDLILMGVTGTNGKTTTCYLTYQMLRELGIKAAYIGTIGFYYGDVKRELPNTTPDILSLYNLLHEAKENGCTHVIMEVSSHSLCEGRIAGLTFDSVAFTNLTQDHLDFHKTMDNYLKAKLLILNYLKDGGYIVANADDEHSKYFVKDNANKVLIGYGEDADIKVTGTKFTPSSTDLKFTEYGEDKEVNNNLTSKFNVYNYLTCYGILRSIGIDSEDIKRVTPNVYPPNGRCEIIHVNDGYAVIDYAHTPDAVEKIISAMNEIKEGRIITVIGCGGDRDPMKRPIMGNIAYNNSDHVIFTNDNPRTENPFMIMYDITKELTQTDYDIEYDRTKAIEMGIEMLQPNDILLILGKGHEDYQIIGHEKIHLDDHEIVNNWIKKHSKTHVIEKKDNV